MKDLKPSLQEDHDHFIFHVGTNDLSVERSPELIAKSIIDLATTLSRSGSYDVNVPNIIANTTTQKWMKKDVRGNFYLKEMCKKRNLYLIDHSKKTNPSHLNRGKLHLNQKELKVFEKIIYRF